MSNSRQTIEILSTDTPEQLHRGVERAAQELRGAVDAALKRRGAA